MNLLKIGVVALAWSLAQGAPGGSVTGTILDGGKRLAAGVRVAAMVVPGVSRSATDGSVLASITQTDSNGRYRLENIPPGRYYIVAGSVSSPTFYPGTLAQNSATIVSITQDGPSFAGMDFTLNVASNAPPGNIVMAGRPCCRVSAQVVLEGGNRLPPSMRLTAVTTYPGGLSTRPAGNEAIFPLSAPASTPFQVALDGLPPGLVLKSISQAGKDVGLSPLTVNADSPTRIASNGTPIFDTATLTLTIGFLPVSTLKTVRVRGNVSDVAPELDGTSLILASIVPDGPRLEARLQPDRSFDVPSIPVGTYRAGLRSSSGNEVLSWTLVAVADAAPNRTISFRNNPFPEFEHTPPTPSVFTSGKSTEITGVVTQRLTKLADSPERAGYFRMDVKDERTGAVTPWAIYVAQDWQVPSIRVGETLTVPGTLSTDGTNRFFAAPF